MKKLKLDKNEYIILFGLFFLSISLGLWSNFQQLWLESNQFDVTQISNIISGFSLVSIVVMFVFGKKINLNILKKFILSILKINITSILILYFLNGTHNKELIITFFGISEVTAKVLLASIYPLILQFKKSDEFYSQRKLTEYFGQDIGLVLGYILFSSIIFDNIELSLNNCILVSVITGIIAFIIFSRIENKNNNEKVSVKEKSSFIQYIRKHKFLKLYITYILMGKISYSIALGMNLLVLTNYLNFNPSIAILFILIIEIFSDFIGYICLKRLQPKNDYITVLIKFGLRLILYILAFATNNIMIMVISIAWAVLISTAYENVIDAPYVNKVPIEKQFSFNNFKYIVGYLGGAIGIFIAGRLLPIGVNYIFGIAAIFLAIQLAISLYITKLRKNEKGVETSCENN